MDNSKRISLMLAAASLLLFAFGGSGGLSIVPGPRDATVYYESLNKTPAFNQMVVALRTGEPAKYLAEKGTDLEILDVTQSPQPDPTLALPSLYVTAGESVLYKTTITDVQAPVVLEAIKAHGG